MALVTTEFTACRAWDGLLVLTPARAGRWEARVARVSARLSAVVPLLSPRMLDRYREGRTRTRQGAELGPQIGPSKMSGSPQQSKGASLQGNTLGSLTAHSPSSGDD